jgi:hypothetical protein
MSDKSPQQKKTGQKPAMTLKEKRVVKKEKKEKRQRDAE